jgi:cAMP-specific phosphodiesterase 4/high affinity cAMP-specific and IBMX-insensitive 3',5'-cyclic phosphodiesterase 8
VRVLDKSGAELGLYEYQVLREWETVKKGMKITLADLRVLTFKMEIEAADRLGMEIQESAAAAYEQMQEGAEAPKKRSAKARMVGYLEDLEEEMEAATKASAALPEHLRFDFDWADIRAKLRFVALNVGAASEGTWAVAALAGGGVTAGGEPEQPGAAPHWRAAGVARRLTGTRLSASAAERQNRWEQQLQQPGGPVEDGNFTPRLMKAWELLPWRNCWEFDAISSAQRTRWPLCCTALGLVRQQGLVQALQLDEPSLCRFLFLLECDYGTNQYHNSVHAADVLHAFATMLEVPEIATSISQLLGALPDGERELVMLAAFFAAVVHDFGHPGRGNAWQIETGSELAMRYNDRAPLEAMHAAEAFGLLTGLRQCNFLQSLDKPRWQRFRGLAVALVLATDLAAHASLLAAFERLPLPAGGAQERIEVAAAVAAGDYSVESNPLALRLALLLKAADIGHAAKPTKLHQKWAEAMRVEVTSEQELAAGVALASEGPGAAPPTLTRAKWAVDQIGFLDGVAEPLFAAVQRGFGVRGDAWRPGDHIEANRKYWAAEVAVEEEAEELAEAKAAHHAKAKAADSEAKNEAKAIRDAKQEAIETQAKAKQREEAKRRQEKMQNYPRQQGHLDNKAARELSKHEKGKGGGKEGLSAAYYDRLMSAMSVESDESSEAED